MVHRVQIHLFSRVDGAPILSRSVGMFTDEEHSGKWAMEFRQTAAIARVDATAVPVLEDEHLSPAYIPQPPSIILARLCEDARDHVALVPVS